MKTTVIDNSSSTTQPFALTAMIKLIQELEEKYKISVYPETPHSGEMSKNSSEVEQEVFGKIITSDIYDSLLDAVTSFTATFESFMRTIDLTTSDLFWRVRPEAFYDCYDMDFGKSKYKVRARILIIPKKEDKGK